MKKLFCLAIILFFAQLLHAQAFTIDSCEILTKYYKQSEKPLLKEVGLNFERTNAMACLASPHTNAKLDSMILIFDWLTTKKILTKDAIIKAYNSSVSKEYRVDINSLEFLKVCEFHFIKHLYFCDTKKSVFIVRAYISFLWTEGDCCGGNIFDLYLWSNDARTFLDNTFEVEKVFLKYEGGEF